MDMFIIKRCVCLSWIYLAVVVPYTLASEAPSLTDTPPRSMSARRGGSLTFTCNATGTPPLYLTWHKDGKLLHPSNKITIINNSLRINNIQDDDVGRYMCKFENEHGEATYTVVVVLEGGAVIRQPPRNQTVNSGQSVTFSCSVEASPGNVTINWYKDGTDIRLLTRLLSRSTISTDGSLFIRSVGASDSGVYRCTAFNGLGAPMSAEAHLSVIFTPLVDSQRWKTNLHIALGRTEELPCPVEGFPPVTHVEWRRLHKPLNFSSPRLKVNEEFSLIIYNVTSDDSGWYACTPYNENGRGVQSDIMNVVALDPPYFTIHPEPEYSVNVGGTVTFACAARSTRIDRTMISWKKMYSAPLDPSRTSQTSQGNLTIRNVRKEDGGMYKCIASDGDITSSASTQLLVNHTTPHAVYNVTAFFRHYDIRVSWIPGFDGGANQSFAVLLRKSKSSDGNWQQLPEQSKTMYTIYGLTPDTGYEVKVLSRNKLGDGEMSEVIVGRTLGYTPGALSKLPTSSAGLVMFPTIVKPIGPAPSTPENFSVVHNGNGGVVISWTKPAKTEVPILYYRVEYKKQSENDWTKDSPVLANQTSTTFVPQDINEDEVVKYYFRLRSYGLLAYSPHTEAIIIFFPEKEEETTLTLGAKVGIGIAALLFVGLLIAVMIILCDLKPGRREQKTGEDKNGARTHYTLAPQTLNGASEWQSFYPYHGGRFTINGDRDNIYVIDNHRDNTVTHSSTERDGSMVRHEQGWYFPRDGHPEQDLTRTHDSGSSGKPPPHGVGYTANYSTYNGLLHGYYDARTGTQISPSIINYPRSGIEVSDTTDGLTSTDTASRYHMSLRTKDRPGANNLSLPRNESQPIYANHAILTRNAHSNWFAPHSQNHNEQHTSTLSPISLSYDREQEIVLKPSLPRHSSMRPSIQVPPDDDEEPPFDPQLSIIRENSLNSPEEQTNSAYYENEDLYTNGWVASQANSKHQQRSNSLHHPSVSYPRAQRFHTLSTHDEEVRNSFASQYPPSAHHGRERGSSISSSVNEMRAHYNRDRLLGTVERVRSTSSRSRRPESLASMSSDQLSPQPNRYVHSPLPPPYQLTECYPELVSPVYYNNNNNRQSQSDCSPRRRSHQTSVTSPHYENSGLLTQTNYNRGPSLSGCETLDPGRHSSSANVTSGLGSSWYQSYVDGNARKYRPSWSRSSAPTPYEYDMSCESSPAALPQFSNGRQFGLYSKPRFASYRTQQAPAWSHQHPKTSYDPSFLASSHSPRHSRPSQRAGLSPFKTGQAPSDSVDENYEFDPILIDSEPQDFFHVQSENMNKSIGEPTSNRPPQRRSLYAEQRTPPASNSSQRLDRLRNEFTTFQKLHNSGRPMTLRRLESDIL